MPSPTTDTVSYLYDNSGSLATVIDSGSGISTTYYYDFIDRLAKYTEKGTNYSHSVEYGFDSKNNLSTQKETINGITRETGYTYDADNRLQTVTGNGQAIEYTYDDLGRLEKQEVKNGTETVLTMEYTYYDLEEDKTSVQVKSIEYTADNYSITYTYTYDGNGNILSISDGTNTYQYEYADGNKLYRENDPITGVSKSYLYADTGNPYVEIQRPYVNGSVGSEETYISYSWDSTWGDMLTYYGDIPLYYDTVGNMTGDGTYTYTWEHGRELAEMASGDGRWSFTYDANGMRTGKTRRNVFTDELIDTYSYVYNGSQLSQMTKNGQTLNFFYDGEGRPTYFTYGVFTYYYVTNLQGDVIAILDSTGTVVVNYHYDAYGVMLQTGGTMATTLGTLNPLTYRGYVYDHETGLYYLQSRYYNPSIRQFISPDAFVSTGQGYLGYNMFAYCGNNPVNNYDPEGTYYVSFEDRFKPVRTGGRRAPFYSQAKKKYNAETVSVYERGSEGIVQKEINAEVYYLGDGRTNIHISGSLQVKSKAEQNAVLDVIMDSPLYDEETFGTIDFMWAQWEAHNLSYTIASSGTIGYWLMGFLSGSSNPIESSKELDIRSLNNLTFRQRALYTVISWFY